MGTEFLVACLWVVVLVYWFWSRLPARSDTVGVYRRALHVLEHTAPTRVVPAYRLSAPAIAPVVGAPSPLLRSATNGPSCAAGGETRSRFCSALSW